MWSPRRAASKRYPLASQRMVSLHGALAVVFGVRFNHGCLAQEGAKTGCRLRSPREESLVARPFLESVTRIRSYAVTG